MATRTGAHEKTIGQLKKELLPRFGKSIDSIVLFGSAARDEFRPLESDIDILIVANNGKTATAAEISSAIGELDLANSTATSLVYLSAHNLSLYLAWGSPFLENVLKEGVILYDNGTFEQVRRRFVAAGQ